MEAVVRFEDVALVVRLPDAQHEPVGVYFLDRHASLKGARVVVRVST